MIILISFIPMLYIDAATSTFNGLDFLHFADSYFSWVFCQLVLLCVFLISFSHLSKSQGSRFITFVCAESPVAVATLILLKKKVIRQVISSVIPQHGSL